MPYLVNMFAVIGFSRFPFFCDRGKVIGASSGNKEFDDYVASLDKNLKSIVIFSLYPNYKLRRRFVIKNIAINTATMQKELAVNKVFIYPDYRPVRTFLYDYCYGFRILSPRGPIFFPILSIRRLSKKEVDAALRLGRYHAFSMKALSSFFEELGISVIRVEERYENTLIELYDSELNTSYIVSIDKKGFVKQTNVCISFSELHITEFVVLLREQQEIFVYSGVSDL